MSLPAENFGPDPDGLYSWDYTIHDRRYSRAAWRYWRAKNNGHNAAGNFRRYQELRNDAIRCLREAQGWRAAGNYARARRKLLHARQYREHMASWERWYGKS